MKWFSWFRRSTPEAAMAAVARPAGAAARRKPRVDWEKIDRSGEGDDPFATGQLELQSDHEGRSSGPAAKDAAYNPYDTGIFTTKLDRMPDLHRDRAARPSRPESRKKAAYNPYDTSTFHGSWNRNSR